MIKLLQLSPEKQRKIVDWLTSEIDWALTSRSELEDKWAKWTTNFESKPEREVKNFPFEKASNIVVPIQSITVNAIVSRHINTIYSQAPFWTARALSSQWTDHAAPTERLLEHAQRYEMKLATNLISYLLDVANLGTGIAKVPWIIETKKSKRYGEDGSIVAYEQELSNGPRFIPIPRVDIITPISSSQSIQEMPWIAHRFRLRYPTILRRDKAGAYINGDKVKNFIMTEVDKVTDEQERLRYLQRVTVIEEYELFEVWCDYDYDEDGNEEACVFTFSKDASALLRPILNPYTNQYRPFIATQCFPRAHSFDGIGMGQKLERLQEALSTVANQAIDNGSISNVSAFKAKKGSGIKPGVKIYPGKVFLLNDLTDLEPMPIGAGNLPAAQMITAFLRDMAERETGVSDYNLGKESSIVGSAATATSTLALIQEGSKMFDFLLKIQRNSFNDMAYIIYSQYAQFKPRYAFTLLGNESELIEEVWTAQEGNVKEGLQFELTASSAYVNQALERESWSQLFNLIMGYYMKVFEASQVITNMQAPPELRILAGRMISSGQLIMERIISKWNILDTDRLLLQQEDIVALTQSAMQTPSIPPQMQMMMQMAAQGGGGQGGTSGPNQGAKRGASQPPGPSRVQAVPPAPPRG